MLVEIKLPDHLAEAVSDQTVSLIEQKAVRILQHAQQQKALRKTHSEKLVNGLLISNEEG